MINIRLSLTEAEKIIISLITIWFLFSCQTYAHGVNAAVSSAKKLYGLQSLKKQKAWKEALEAYENYKKALEPEEKGMLKAFLERQGIKYHTMLHGSPGQILSKNEYIYIFMSSSVPLVVWHNYALAVAKLRKEAQGNIGFILRGCIGGCRKVMPTIRFILKATDVNGKRLKVPVLIDPLLFRLYGIKRVPAFVYAKGVSIYNRTASVGLPVNLRNKNITAYKLLGDCSFGWALQQLYRESGDGKLLQLYGLLNRSWFERGEPHAEK